jgi:hypothetical protein
MYGRAGPELMRAEWCHWITEIEDEHITLAYCDAVGEDGNHPILNGVLARSGH